MCGCLPRDETNLIQITVNHVNASANHLADTSTAKIDPPFALVSEVNVCMRVGTFEKRRRRRILFSLYMHADISIRR